MHNHYDYIFAGAGMAALSLLCRMMDDAYFRDKTILLIDADGKDKNDRTWSFWEKEEGYFEELVHKSWPKVKVSNNDWSKTFELDPYRYKMIRAIDFYQHVFGRIKKFPNISFVQDEIVDFHESKLVEVVTQNGRYSGGMVYDSLFKLDFLKNESKVPVLYQHFKGYVIHCDQEQDDEVLHFMDFNIDQKDTLQFMYVLPFDKHTCLVEHTYFSQYFVPENTYDNALKEYCNRHYGDGKWKVDEVEKGVIPMSTAKLRSKSGKQIIPIGTQGGFTKASSGYTFYFVQKAADRMIDEIKKNRIPKHKKSRFDLYDALLLRVLANDEGYGHQLFSNLFKSTKPKNVFRFLNEESNLIQDLAIINSSPRKRFLKALMQELRYRIRLLIGQV